MANVQNTLVNKDFERAIKNLRRILPKLSFGLLVGTYLISALIMGLFHAENATNAGMIVASFVVPLAIQAGRGTLVFFFQLNPARIQGRFSMGVLAATGLLGLSIWECLLVMQPFGMAWMVSVCTLMLIGYIIEIMILKETKFATEMELFRNEDQWQEIGNFYTARERFRNFMDALIDGQVPETIYLTQPEVKALQQETGQPQDGDDAHEETSALPQPNNDELLEADNQDTGLEPLTLSADQTKNLVKLLDALGQGDMLELLNDKTPLQKKRGRPKKTINGATA